MAADADAAGRTGPRLDGAGCRGVTRVLIAVLVASAVINKVGDATAPTLAVGAPLLLVFVAPQARYLLLASRTVGTVPLVAVALARRLLTVPIVYRLGALHGTGVLGWFDRRFRRIGRMMRHIERWFGRRRMPVLVAFPGGLTTFLAGDVGLRFGLVLGLTAAGLLARIAFTLWLGEVFSAPLDATLSFINGHQAQTTGLTLALTGWHLLRHRSRSRRLAAEDAAASAREITLTLSTPEEIVLPSDPATQVVGETP